MAAAQRIDALLAELISVVSNIQDRNSTRFKGLKLQSQTILKESSAGRVNKFDVAKRLDGLQEKFQVVGNDALADALCPRLVELDAKRCYWAPDALFLLLELSDKPATKSKAERVLLLDTVSPPPLLTWADIDPLDTDGDNIWKDIDYGVDSSDDNLSLASSDISIPRIVPQSSKVPRDEFIPQEDIFLSVEDGHLVSSIENAQAWRFKSTNTRPIEDSMILLTELQIIRELIFMLQGLPNSLFKTAGDDITVDSSFCLFHTSNDALFSMLRSFSCIGVCIWRLRRFIALPERIPFIQTFQRELESLVFAFDAFLSDIQAQYSAGMQSICVSLVELLHNIRKETKLHVDLANLIVQLENATEQNAFLCIDLLYDLVCTKQAMAEDDGYKIISKVFFKCFRSYIAPIQHWMKTGSLDESPGLCFIKSSHNFQNLKSLWHEWFTLEEEADQLAGPKFLRSVAGKILTAGKSMIFLRHLGISPEKLNTIEDSSIDYEAIFQMADTSPLIPFSGLVDQALEQMVNANHAVASYALRTELDTKCGLWLSMQALDYTYLGKDLALLTTIDHRVFDLIDKGSQSWNDRFLLTEHFQQTFGNVPCVDASRVIARCIKVSRDEFEKHCRSVKILKALSLEYVLPWPVANIISKKSISTYQRVSMLLMQIRRAKYALEKRSSSTRYFKLQAYSKDDILSFSIRYHFLWFINILYYHFTELVISSSSREMRKSMALAEDVDGMISAHQNFMEALEEQCLLSKSLTPIYQAVISVLDLCMQFSDMQAARYLESQHAHANQSATFLHLPSPRYRRRRRFESQEDDEDSTEDDNDDDEDSEIHHLNEGVIDDRDNTFVSFMELPYKERLLNMKTKFQQYSRFIEAGLRGIGRTNSQSSWEMLADRLQWRGDYWV
ncbi:hypothetical protein LOZ61_000082 [Ophidiomyces ophidiicola]|nr:hypothetical protein LOZ61_000082 [Ophidiomyces ophidiicola]KAI1931568.1 hypothetical protein LOZ60_000100 [Ophidiomyces ophidiicola]KAI1969098.1 hypothetical protein LOZ59_000124 [Ophidiomyces ophidiicola]KAI2034085.1 hypothetical protein LOZ48_001853 [Ophidiomyces ophidiicola]KAI2150355.1 hypothetical protein LOZ27_000260 [Ophidiomyces ophidiicola]